MKLAAARPRKVTLVLEQVPGTIKNCFSAANSTAPLLSMAGSPQRCPLRCQLSHLRAPVQQI